MKLVLDGVLTIESDVVVFLVVVGVMLVRLLATVHQRVGHFNLHVINLKYIHS